MDQKRQFSSFFLADTLFGIPVENVQEITAAVDITPVPLASTAVKGLINLRGHIVTAIDLRTCLRLNDVPGERASVNVIVRVTEGYASLLVDQVGEIIEVDQETFEPPPETLLGAARDLIRGTYKLENRLMHVLDLERTLHTTG